MRFHTCPSMKAWMEERRCFPSMQIRTGQRSQGVTVATQFRWRLEIRVQAKVDLFLQNTTGGTKKLRCGGEEVGQSRLYGQTNNVYQERIYQLDLFRLRPHNISLIPVTGKPGSATS